MSELMYELPSTDEMTDLIMDSLTVVTVSENHHWAYLMNSISTTKKLRFHLLEYTKLLQREFLQTHSCVENVTLFWSANPKKKMS